MNVKKKAFFGGIEATLCSLFLGGALGIGGTMFLGQKFAGQGDGAVPENASVFSSVVYSNRRLADFIGQERVVALARECLQEFRSGLFSRAVLIRGSAGSGKQLLARAMAGELGCQMIEVPASIFVEHSSLFVKIVQKLALERSVMLLINHIESIETSKSTEFFIEAIKRLKSSTRIMCIATSDVVQKMNMRLERSFLFDREIHIPMLTAEGRLVVLKNLLKVRGIQDDILQLLSEKTSGFNVPLLRELVQQVRLHGRDFDVVCQQLKRERLNGYSSDEEKRFCDVIGQDNALREVKEVFDFLKDRDRFVALGARMPSGILLHGPPGSGKTLIARALAGETGAHFIFVSGSGFVSKYVGSGPNKVREIFERARILAQGGIVILFIDEIDGLCARSDRSDSAAQVEYDNTINEFLAQMGGMVSNKNIIIIGATNLIEKIDPALLRPGRFDRKVVVPLPDRVGLAQLIAHYARQVALDDECDVDSLAQAFATLTIGFSGAEIENFVNEAAMLAARDHATSVRMEHFVRALEKVAS